jgi:hypothetical protein
LFSTHIQTRNVINHRSHKESGKEEEKNREEERNCFNYYGLLKKEVKREREIDKTRQPRSNNTT